VKPRKTTTSFFCFLHFFAFFLIRVRKTALLSGFWGRAYLASYLAFLPKSRHFCPKTGDSASFRTYIVFLLVYQCFLHKHRPKSADKPACISLGYHHIAFSKINSKSIWQQCHVGSNPTVCAKSSTLRGAAFYFCGKLCKGCKVGFEQPVPGALRPAGLQQSRGLLQGRGRIPPSAPSITTQFHIG